MLSQNRTHFVAFLSALLFCASFSRDSAIFAQSHITHSVTTKVHDQAAYGRDLWFTTPQIYDANTSYYMLYVSANKNTMIHVAITGSSAQTYHVSAGQTI